MGLERFGVGLARSFMELGGLVLGLVSYKSVPSAL